MFDLPGVIAWPPALRISGGAVARQPGRSARFSDISRAGATAAVREGWVKEVVESYVHSSDCGVVLDPAIGVVCDGTRSRVRSDSGNAYIGSARGGKAGTGLH